MTKRSLNGLLNIFQNGSIHDLKTASIRYNVAKERGEKIKVLSKVSIRKGTKEEREQQHKFLSDINNIEFEQTFKQINKEERIKKNKKLVMN